MNLWIFAFLVHLHIWSATCLRVEDDLDGTSSVDSGHAVAFSAGADPDDSYNFDDDEKMSAQSQNGSAGGWADQKCSNAIPGSYYAGPFFFVNRCKCKGTTTVVCPSVDCWTIGQRFHPNKYAGKGCMCLPCNGKCDALVPGSVASGNKCKCPTGRSLSRGSPVCGKAKATFDPDGLKGQGCECAFPSSPNDKENDVPMEPTVGPSGSTPAPGPTSEEQTATTTSVELAKKATDGFSGRMLAAFQEPKTAAFILVGGCLVVLVMLLTCRACFRRRPDEEERGARLPMAPSGNH